MSHEQSYHMAMGDQSPPGGRMMDVIIGSIAVSERNIDSIHFDEKSI